MDIEIRGPDLPVQTCVRRLSDLQDRVRLHALTDSLIVSKNAAGGQRPRPDPAAMTCDISWCGNTLVSSDTWDDSMVQARSGMMHVHGRQDGRPRPLGVELPSVISGILSGQGVLAALVARARGSRISRVQTSVLGAGLFCLSQYIARATSGGERDEATSVDQLNPGPPFPTADGRWIEVETLSPEAWRTFWSALQVEPSMIAQGWKQFRPRYATAVCHMPPRFHDVTSRCPLSKLTILARASGVSLTPVRHLGEIRSDPRLANIDRPEVEPLPNLASAESRSSKLPKTFHPGDPSCLPLAGIHLVEATSRIQGPLAGQLLRLLGATVTRIEPPGGDIARMEAPLSGAIGAFFLAMNRGKQAVEIDLKRPDGREELRGLVSGADVFLHNWRPGRSSEWELGCAQMANNNSRLVYCEASGWGQMADDAPELGMDFLVQAYSGLGDAVTIGAQSPAPSRLLIADVMGGLIAAEGILTGLYRQAMTERGSMVRTSLLAGAMALNAHLLEDMRTGDGARRQRHLALSTAVHDLPHPCNDLTLLPHDPLLAPLFEPLGETGWVPASPWSFL